MLKIILCKRSIVFSCKENLLIFKELIVVNMYMRHSSAWVIQFYLSRPLLWVQSFLPRDEFQLEVHAFKVL